MFALLATRSCTKVALIWLVKALRINAVAFQVGPTCFGRIISAGLEHFATHCSDIVCGMIKLTCSLVARYQH